MPEAEVARRKAAKEWLRDATNSLQSQIEASDKYLPPGSDPEDHMGNLPERVTRLHEDTVASPPRSRPRPRRATGEER